ncbi:S8 family peptidase [Streptomyces cinerochromogenes]|uniref:S8 family peptidase n=1 Tax=Streptomyces cinerochromogenes TaxID=66422 RepID=UPI0016717C14|nr:S8 family serine peptidase [Streptomyces cinerochromogenes]GGS74103.1 type VII secretion-associated serine protease [Streptomyces cinerochromogenes]
MKYRTLRATCTAAALTGLLCTLATAPAQAATPVGWEGNALSLSAAQRQSQGEGVTVAVLDSGVVVSHPALKGRVTTGPDYRQDGLKPGDPDWGGHGTAMASDVLKVAPKARILSIRVTSDKDDKEVTEKELEERRQAGNSPVADGIRYAVDHGADVISMSFGSGDGFASYDKEETEAVASALRAGVTLLASAGNSGDELNDSQYPAGYPGVIAVAATQQGGTRAGFSTVHTYNDVAAPGVGIVSAKNTGGYEPVNGTSPACALAAGVVALMYAKNPKLTPDQANDVLIATTHRPAGGGSALLGYGLINADAAVTAAASPPKDTTGAVTYRGKTYLGTPDGTPKTRNAPMEQSLWLTGLVSAGVGVVLLAGGVLLARSGRRRTPVPPPGMAQPRG